MLKIAKSKTELLWSLFFPLALATCFFIAFGNMTSKDEEFNSIPVAVVIEKEDADIKAALEEVSEKGADDLIHISYLDRFTQTYQTLTTVAAYDPSKIPVIQNRLE